MVGWIATHIFWVLGIVGSFGAVGVAIAVAVFGVPLMYIIAQGIQFLRALFDWFRTPLGQAVGIVLIVLLACVVTDIHRSRVDAAAYKVQLRQALKKAAQNAEDERRARDSDIRTKMAADADRRIAAVQQVKEKLDKEVASDEQALQNRPGCLVTPDDLTPGGVRHAQ